MLGVFLAMRSRTPPDSKLGVAHHSATQQLVKDYRASGLFSNC